jgi:hypothetical protein
MKKKNESGIRDERHISESLETIFGVKLPNSLKGRIRIRDRKIQIQDPEYTSWISNTDFMKKHLLV